MSTTVLKTLFNDKIFQYLYQKKFNNRVYEDFYNLSDNDKIEFLASLYLHVSAKGVYGFKFRDREIMSTSTKKEDATKINTVTNEVLDKINEIKDENKKSFLMNKYNKLNILKQDTISDETNTTKTTLRNIMKKYSSTPKILPETEINTVELRGLIYNLENCIKKNNDNDINDLENYVKDGEVNDSTINKQFEDDGHMQVNIPTYQSSFYKADYNKCKKTCMETVVRVSEKHYQIDNREIFLIDNLIDQEWVKSKNNSIYMEENLENYKKLSYPSKKSRVNSLSNVIFNNRCAKILINSATRKTFNKKDSQFLKNKQIHFGIYPTKKIIEDLILLNETISDTTEANLEKTKKKVYFGRDLIERIYFCPTNSVIVLDYNEANKLGILLLDSLRMEGDNEYLRHGADNLINETNFKFEELNKRYNEERQNLLAEINFLKENSQKKLEIVYEYVSALKSKLEYTQRMINEANSIGEIDNSQIIESINKNLENLTKNNIEIEFGEGDNTTGIENPFSDVDSTSKSIDFYVRKKLNKNPSNQSQVQSQVHNKLLITSPKK